MIPSVGIQSLIATPPVKDPPDARETATRVKAETEDRAGTNDGQPDVWEALDAALHLGGGRSVLGILAELSQGTSEEKLQALARVLQRGVVGYEYREVNGEPMKVFIDAAIGSDLHRAPLVRGGRFDAIF